MIGKLNGVVADSTQGHLIVQASHSLDDPGVGYAVHSPTRQPDYLFRTGSRCELWIHTHVREDAIELFGFLSSLEKEIFLMLVSVNGVGPKVGLAILSLYSSKNILLALAEKNKEVFVKTPGIGKKTAERIVLELEEKAKKKIESLEWLLKPTSVRSADSLPLPFEISEKAKNALLSMGFKSTEAADLIQNALIDPDLSNPNSIGELVKTALKQVKERPTHLREF